MADDKKQQMMIHQMTVKGKRLDLGLRKFVEEWEKEFGNLDKAYCYALACLGDDESKKKVMDQAPNDVIEVYETLKSEKLVKAETADKIIADARGSLSEKEGPREFFIDYDHATKKSSSDHIPDSLKKVYDRVIEAWTVANRFPNEITTAEGFVWRRVKIDDMGNRKYRINYAVE